MKRNTLAALAALAAAATVGACSDDNNGGTDVVVDAGTDADLSDVIIDEDTDVTPMPDAGSDTGGDTGGEETASLQLLHLATGAPAVDVYVGETLLVDDLDPLQGTGFFPVAAGSDDIVVNLTAADAADASAPLATFTLAGGLAAGGAYTAAAVDDPAATETSNVNLVVLTDARVANADLPPGGPVSIRVLHASPGSPSVDIDVEPTVRILAGTDYAPEVDNASYGDFTEYLSVPSDAGLAGNIVTLNLNASSGEGAAADENTFVGAFQVPAALAGFVTTPIVVAAVGSLADNTFQLVAFPAADDTTPTPVDGVALTAAARLQVIHNGPGAEVDVYLGDALALDDFAYATATPYLTLPATEAADPIGLTIRAGSDDGSGDALLDAPAFALGAGPTVAVATLDAAGALRVDASAGREVDGDAANVLILGYHGAPTFGPVDLGGDSIIATDIPFGSFTDGYLEVPSEVTAGLISVWLTGTDDPILQTGTIDFSAFEEVPLVGVISTDSAAALENKLLLFTPSGGPAIEYQLTTP